MWSFILTTGLSHNCLSIITPSSHYILVFVIFLIYISCLALHIYFLYWLYFSIVFCILAHFSNIMFLIFSGICFLYTGQMFSYTKSRFFYSLALFFLQHSLLKFIFYLCYQSITYLVMIFFIIGPFNKSKVK